MPSGSWLAANWKDLVVSITAVGGFVLSIVALVLRERDSKIRIRVSLNHMVGMRSGEEVFVVKVANQGHRSAQISTLHFQVRGSGKLFAVLAPVGDRSMPCFMAVGEQFGWHTSVGEFLKTMNDERLQPPWKIRAAVCDSFDKTHWSKWLIYPKELPKPRNESGVS